MMIYTIRGLLDINQHGCRYFSSNHFLSMTWNFYYPTWRASVGWVHSERRMNACWMEFGEHLCMMNGDQMQRANVSVQWTVNAGGTICKCKMNNLFIVPQELSLHWVERKAHTERRMNAQINGKVGSFRDCKLCNKEKKIQREKS